MQKTIVGIVVLVGLVGGIIFIATRSEDTQQTQTTTAPQSDPTFTLAQVQMHNSVSSCWTIVHGLVYDVTSWINSHPGGKEAIISMCGKDSTSAFMLQHGDSNKIANILAGFKIGIFTD